MNEGSRCRPADALQTPRQSDAGVRCSSRRSVRPEPPTELNGARVAEAGVRHGRSEADLVAHGRDRDSGRFLGEYIIL